MTEQQVKSQVNSYEQILDFIAPVDKQAQAEELEYIKACELASEEN
jgi:hypothetical protein